MRCSTRLRSRGPLAGIVHTLAFETARAGFAARDRLDSPRVAVEVKGLFLLAKAMAADLEIAARAGGACLIAATALGGRFASAGCTTADFSPGQGGIAGLVKTLAREWPAVRARVVDFSPLDPGETIAGRLATEMFAPRRLGRGRLRSQDRRIRLRTDREPARERGRASGAQARRSGADFRRSARHHRPGRGRAGAALAADPLDRRHDSAARGRRIRRHAGLESRSRDQAASARPAAAPGAAGRPGGNRDAYQALRRAREVRENLEELRRPGATVAYRQADVRDPRAVAACSTTGGRATAKSSG